jgi:DNA polymerase-3 subunit delta
MFAERQVVLLKEAQQMKDIDKLESYIENPLKSTVLVVSYKEKHLMGAAALQKLLRNMVKFFCQKRYMTTSYLHGLTVTCNRRVIKLLKGH